ncbi:hypothetical protein VUR80DRAFT_5611 [Thermomyces stellatus]
MRPISRKAEIPSSKAERLSGPWAWRSFGLRDSQFSRMAQDIKNTGLGSLEDVFLSIVPPLSARRKLPWVEATVELSRKRAAQHEQKGHLDEAASTYLCLFRKAATLPREDDIAYQATALLMEFWRAVTDAIQLRKAQQFDERDIVPLENLETQLQRELQNSKVDDILPALMGLYEAQCRKWECPLVKTQKPFPGEDPMFSLFRYRTVVHECSGDNWMAIRYIWREEFGNIKDGRDILGWAPLHYVVAEPLTSYFLLLLQWRPDINTQDLR